MNINEEIAKLRAVPLEQLEPMERELLADNERSNNKLQEIASAMQHLDRERQKHMAICDFTILKALASWSSRTQAAAEKTAEAFVKKAGVKLRKRKS